MNRLYILFFLIFSLNQAFAQSDGCTGVPALTPGGSCVTTAYSMPGSFSDGGLVNASCATGNDRDDGWYQFTANSTYTTVEVTGNEARVVAVFSSCAGTTELACSQQAGGTTATVSFNTVSGTTYFIQIHRRSGGPGASMSGTICVYNSTPPPPSGCTSNTTLYPSTTFTPACNGTPETITTAGYATEYSQVNVVSGTAYTFASSISTDYLTISNNTGATVYAAGTTPVSWTATITGVIRFYNNTNSACGTNTTTRTRTVQCGTPPAPPANDECASAVSLTVNSGTTCTSTTTGTVLGATASSQANSCAGGNDDDDVWYKFTATGSVHNITLSNVAGSVTDLYHSVYSGTCSSIGAPIICSDPNTSTVTGLTAGNVYYVRVYTSTATGNQTTTFNICVSTPPPPPANDECSGAITLTVNPTTTCTSVTSGTVANATASTQSNGCSGTADDDVWYKFVATSTSHFISLTNVSGSTTDLYHSVYSGSCGSPGTALVCSDPNNSTVSGLTIGNTYFVRVYSWTSSSGQTSTFNICVSTCSSAPSNNECSNAITLTPSGTCTGTPGSLACSTPSSQGNSCDATYDDDDVWYKFVATTTTHNIELTNISGNQTDLYHAVFSGSCGSPGTAIKCSDANTSTVTGLTVGNTYYIRVYTWGTTAGATTTFNICVTGCTTAPSNDECSNAITLTPNYPCSPTAGTISCATASTQSNGCSGTADDDVWYKFVASATSHAISLSNIIGSTSDLYFAVYNGTCSSPGAAALCSDPEDNTVTGLTIGNTYYIRVYSYTSTANQTSSFNICVTPPPPPVPGQDCVTPLLACNQTMIIGNPGYAGTGTTTDFTGTGNCTGGEKNSVWYQINIGSNGDFNFTLMPNDGSNSSNGSETDYDFLLWKISGSGTTTNCATISSASGTALMACNFSSDGVTGIAPGGNAPSPVNSYFDAAFEPTVSVNAGDILYLVIQNYSGSTQGFTLDMASSSPGVVTTTPPTTVYWTGGASSTWQDATNWGSCNTYPVCGVNAIVTTASTTQPVITSVEKVKNLTINPGATLTLNAGAILEICGDFINNGNLICDPTSTIIFNNGSVLQNISGSLTGANKLGNLTITKTGGSVVQGSDIEVAGNFTTSNSTSIFNSNGMHFYLGGNFVNANGNTTFSNTGTSGTLEFNGTGSQTYHQGSSQLNLNYVVTNQIGTGITLLTNMFIKSATGSLTLNQGLIITNGFEVNVLNTSPTSVTTGNTTSFVAGNLRRSLLSTGSYDFPVGSVAKGYQRANINFTAATTIGNLLARFDAWPGTAPVQGGSECSTTYNLNAEDNGYWTITANANATSGTYTTTLYPTGATNTATASGWTVMKSATSNAGPWLLNGMCNGASTAGTVIRTGMNGFSLFAAAQATLPLPVELLSFKASLQEDYNLIEWSTASEKNNEYFTLEKLTSAESYIPLTEIQGAGTSNKQHNYSFKDYYPESAINYYRLKQTDFDGQFSYTEVISVDNRSSKENFSISINPNPAHDKVQLEIRSESHHDMLIEIVDLLGNIVSSSVISIENGKANPIVKIDHLQPSMYFIRVIEQNVILDIKKLIKE